MGDNKVDGGQGHAIDVSEVAAGVGWGRKSWSMFLV